LPCILEHGARLSTDRVFDPLIELIEVEDDRHRKNCHDDQERSCLITPKTQQTKEYFVMRIMYNREKAQLDLIMYNSNQALNYIDTFLGHLGEWHDVVHHYAILAGSFLRPSELLIHCIAVVSCVGKTYPLYFFLFR